ncbi:MAG: phosphoenolpyruvate--protein phosphotransferase [Magnetococcus sp. DMHC-6]
MRIEKELINLEAQHPERETTVREFRGIAVSPGIAIGPVHLVARGWPDSPEYTLPTESGESAIALEKERFLTALEASCTQLRQIRDRLASGKYNKQIIYILDAHLLILEDSQMRHGPLVHIQEEYCNAEWAVKRYLAGVLAVFQGMEDAYLREKQQDIRQVGKRLLNNLMGLKSDFYTGFPHPVILVAEEFTPSDMLLMDQDTVLGFVTELGGRTSHTAILAKSLGLPAIVGVLGITTLVQNGDVLVLDGLNGRLVVNPGTADVHIYNTRRTRFRSFRTEMFETTVEPSQTQDGHRVLLKANIELSEDAERAVRFGADGIGLYRTEHLYMNRFTIPSENELYEAFLRAGKRMNGLPVTIRTLDLGGEKQADVLRHPGALGSNPALGLHAIRLCLKRESVVFRSQLRAILRAGAECDIRILFPLVSGLGELSQSLEILSEVKDSLVRDGLPFDSAIKVGIMVEVPAAALCADQLAPRVDFFSIGTNDLIQFTLAVDRLDESVAYLYEPAHPAVLRLIDMTLRAARSHAIPVALCGEMASDPRFTALLIGMGLEELSVTTNCLPLIRKTIRGIDYGKSRDLARLVMERNLPESINHLLEEWLTETFGSDHLFR